MAARGWTVDEIADRLGWSPLMVSGFLDGSHRLQGSMATQIAAVVGTSKELWENLDTAYERWDTLA